MNCEIPLVEEKHLNLVHEIVVVDVVVGAVVA